MSSRRHFLRCIPLVAGSLATCEPLFAAPPATVDEKDPQAAALGYVADAKRVDKAKFPRYAPPQRCAICQFYQGPSSAPSAPCSVLSGKGVAGPGWCSAYAPKPG